MIYRSTITCVDSEGQNRSIGSVEGGISLDVGERFTFNGETGYVARIEHAWRSPNEVGPFQGMLVTNYTINLGDTK